MNNRFAQSVLFFMSFFSVMYLDGLFAVDSYAQISSLFTQTPSSGEGSYVKLEKVDALKNFEQSLSKDKLIIKQAGVYLAIAAGQVGATNRGATGYVDFWFTKNGQPIENSAARLSIDSSTTTGPLITQFIVEAEANDVLGVLFTASGPSLGFVFIKPDNEPGIPSFTLSVTKLD